MTNQPKTVYIVQPYVPSYRVPFFEALSHNLEKADIKLEVIAGQPTGEQALRGDKATPSWLNQVELRTLKLGGRQITFSSSRKIWKHGDAVIVPHMGSSLDALLALFDKKIKVGVWGHIDNYVSNPNILDLFIEKRQLKKANMVFAYTTAGAEFAKAQGVKSENVLTVMNSIDTEALANTIAELEKGAANLTADEPVREEVPTLGFVGGLDSSKRIPFLVESLLHLASLGFEFQLVVAGDGADRHLLNPLIERGWASVLGFQDGEVKATVLRDSVALLSPGRVGLNALDALVAGIPLITTDWPYHAPEIEYLVEGQSLLTSPNDVKSYAEEIAKYLATGNFDRKTWNYPNLEQMVANFTNGIARMFKD